MSLFERLKNKRYDLQEKRKFPGDESGAYKRAKDDLEARKGFSKNKSGGLKADEKNPFVKRSVRKDRVDKLGGDIYDAPKFSQKDFETSLKKKFSKPAKTPSQPMVGGGGGSGSKPPSFKPSSFKKPSDPFVGSYDTPGQTRVKGLEKKAFKKTQPSDIKLPKSFTDFQRNLQDYKDKDKATMRTGKSSSKIKITGGENLTRQDVGMAPPDTPRKSKGVKQSEVSKKAKKFTKQINQNRISSGTPMRKGATNVSKDTDIQVKKMRDRVNQLVGEREKMRSVTGKKNVAGMRNVNKQIKQYTKSMNTKPFVPTVYDKKNKSKKTFAQIKTDRATRKIEKKFAKELSSKQKLAKTFAPATKADRQFFKATTRVTNPIVKRFAPGAKPVVKKVLKGITKLGTPGRIAGATGLALLSPGVRKTVAKVAGATAVGLGLSKAAGDGGKTPIKPTVTRRKYGIDLSQKDNK